MIYPDLEIQIQIMDHVRSRQPQFIPGPDAYGIGRGLNSVIALSLQCQLLCAICVVVAAGKHISANSVPCSCHHIFRIFQLGLANAAHNNSELFFKNIFLITVCC